MDLVMPKSLIFTSPARLRRTLPGLMSLCRSRRECRWWRPRNTCEAMRARMRGGTLHVQLLRSERLPKSISSSTRWTCPVLLDTKPACHWTRKGQPSASTRPRTSFKRQLRSSLFSTFSVLRATGVPVDLMMPFHTVPLAPVPNGLSSISMSSADSRYSRPSQQMPLQGDTRIPEALCKREPVKLFQCQLADATVSQMSSSWRAGGRGRCAMPRRKKSRCALLA
mmetsp:Transcript_13483/g.32112  ORF Transcript_13483/g.32112 Transcript_13483/m.32112 type:complete len:224 (-) Transcript_13483:3-674(-)